jgi:ABC-2 type transport system ATP-binding protein
MGDPVFKIEHVSKRFGNHAVLDDVSLNIDSGDIIGIIGASGAGKTTFLNTLIGFLRPDQGDVTFRLDHLLSYRQQYIYSSVYKKQRMVKQVYGFASQVPSFYEELTTRENLEYFGRLHNLSKDAIKANVHTLLNLLNLEYAADIKAKNLSGGMERRLDIGCALMHDPDVLILDEPTADLDPMLRNHIWELIRKINLKGTTIILSSHHLTELENLCHKVAIIKKGKLVAHGKPEELKKKFVIDQEIVFQIASGEYEKILKKVPSKLISKQKISQNVMHLYTTEPEDTLEKLLNIIKKSKEQLIFIRVTGASLDDVFISIWKDDEEGRT